MIRNEMNDEHSTKDKVLLVYMIEAKTIKLQ